MISLPILFALTFVYLPETPQHLLKLGKTKQAENSLKFLRGCKKNVQDVPEKIKGELLEMANKIDEDSGLKGSSIWNELRKVMEKITF